jgi:hypothetical protein
MFQTQLILQLRLYAVHSLHERSHFANYKDEGYNVNTCITSHGRVSIVKLKAGFRLSNHHFKIFL